MSLTKKNFFNSYEFQGLKKLSTNFDDFCSEHFKNLLKWYKKITKLFFFFNKAEGAVQEYGEETNYSDSNRVSNLNNSIESRFIPEDVTNHLDHDPFDMM